MLPFLIFLTAAVFAFLIPGINFLLPLKRPAAEKLVLGTGLGIVLWVIQSYVFGLLGIRWFSYIYIFGNAIVFLFVAKKNFKIPKIADFNIDYISLLIIVLGTILNLSAVWFIGVRTLDGLYFCCRGVPDAIYHLSLTNELIKNFPPFEPGMVGVHVKNYHYLSNLLSADLARIFNLDFIKTQFQYMSLLSALLLGGSGLVLGGILKLNKVITRWFLIFLYFSGDIIYLLLFLRGQGLNFSVTIVDDASKLLAGPPRAFSIVLLLSGICLLAIFIKKRSLYAGILAAIVLGSLVGFKVYAGLFGLSGLAGLGLYFLAKRQFKMLVAPVLALFIALLYYIPNNIGAGGLYFNGLWRFENFMQHKDLALSKLDYLRLAATQQGNFIVAAVLEILFILIYFVTLFGTVNLGFFQNKKSLKLIPLEINIFLLSGLFVSLIAGSFFYQKTGGANTVQFLINVFIVAALYASMAIYYWTKTAPKFLRYAVFILIFILTLARPAYEIANNFFDISSQKGFYVENGQLAAFNYIKNQTPLNSIIAVEPSMAEDEPFLYASFLTNRRIYLIGSGTLRDHGQNTKAREATLRMIYTSTDAKLVSKLLEQNKIDYLYLSRGVGLSLKNAAFLQKVFGNNAASIYKVVGS